MNDERMKEYLCKWRKAHKDHIREYREAHKDRHRELQRQRRARKKGLAKAKPKPKTYAEIAAFNRANPIQEGWRR
jgi:hypothetical protein